MPSDRTVVDAERVQTPSDWERLHRAFEHLPDRFVIYDAQMRVVYANPAALRGVRLEEALGRRPEEVWPSLVSDRFLRLLSEVREWREAREQEFEIRSPGQPVRWSRVLVTPILDEAGQLQEYFIHSRDNTDAHEAARAAAERLALAEQFAKVGASVPGAIFSFRRSADGTVALPFATAQAADVFGFAPDELAQDSSVMLARIHPDDGPAGQGRIAESARTLAPWHAQFRYQHPTKGLRHLEGWSMPSREPDDAILWHGFIMDVTERELERRALHDREQELRAAQRMESVGRLAGGVAHDFNNLLTVIESYGEMLRESVGDRDGLRDDVDQILGAAHRAANLTRQLLAFSRKQVLKPRSVDLNELCAGALKLLQRLIGEDIEIDFRPSDRPAVTFADPGQIEQVIMNLAVNARDAMPEGGTLRIETAEVVLDEAFCGQHPDATPGPHVLLSVTDTGCGMDEVTLARVFEPFFTTKPVGKGTGLGLATVYGIVRQSVGSVHITSEVGKGTTVRAYLPRAVEVMTPTGVRPASPRPRGSEAVLLVEDEEAVRTLVRRLLSSLGYQVITARRGAEALELAAGRSDVRLLVTDVVMPEMGGRELARRVTALHPRIKVLFMSGYTEHGSVHHGELEEGLHFLPKPFTAEALAKAVRQALDAR